MNAAYEQDLLREYAIDCTLLEDIKDFRSKDRQLKYPLWIDDYLIVVPHKKKNTIDMCIKDGYGHEYGDYWDRCSYTDDILAVARDLVSRKYWKR